MRMIDQLAASRQGLLTLLDVQRAGLTRHQVTVRLRSGEWERVHRGVYRLAVVPPSWEQVILAACLAAGRGAVTSHRSAATVWRLVDRAPDRPVVTVDSSRSPRLRGVEVHRSADLDPRRTVVHAGLPCTDPLRTLVDLAGVAPRPELDDAVDRALATRLVTVGGLAAEVGRLTRPGRRGAAALGRALETRGYLGAPAPSVLESRTLRVLAGGGVHPTGLEVHHDGPDHYRLDMNLAPGLAMEVDGYAWHFTPEQASRDERRRSRIRRDGTFLLVFTWLDVMGDGPRVVAEVLAVMAERGGVAAGRPVSGR